MELYRLWLNRVLFSSQTLFQFSSLFSLLGLILAVASLTVAIIAFSLFSSSLESVIIDRQGHSSFLSQSALSKAEFLEPLEEYKDYIKNQSFFLRFEGLIVKDQAFKGVFFEALEDHQLKEPNFLKNRLLEGDRNRLSNHSVLLGTELAKKLDLSIGSLVSVMVSEDLIFSRRQAQFQVDALIDFGRYELNSHLVLMPLSSAKKLGFEKISGVKLWFKSYKALSGTAFKKGLGYPSLSKWFLSREISKSLSFPHSMSYWENDPFFSVISADKKIIFFVLMILIISSGFNVSSSLFIQVFRRTKEISLLKALGISKNSLRNLFLLNALFLGVVGSGLGILLGLLFVFFLVFIQNQWGFLPAQTYQIHNMVWGWNFYDLFLIFFVSLLVIIVSALLPARRAYKMSVKKGLSY